MAEEKKSTEIAQLVIAKLSNEEYGISITQVQEIIKIPEITRIPGMPDFIEGVINLRGKIIPIIDLRKRFNLEYTQESDEARIIVTIVDGQSAGLVVDSVSEVIRLPSEAIDPIPSTISHVGSEYLSGVGKLENRLIILLSLEKILSELEKGYLRKIGKGVAPDNTV